jgi:hypothetical protein
LPVDTGRVSSGQWQYIELFELYVLLTQTFQNVTQKFSRKIIVLTGHYFAAFPVLA